MATDTRSIAFLNTSDANFRTWVAAVKSALTAIGLTQTSDTGQIDTTTVLAPTAANQNRGSAVYTPNDSLTNYYLIFGFGSRGSGALQPAIYLTLCWATDGASTPIGSQQSSQLSFYTNNANSGATFNFHSCKSGSAIGFSVNEDGIGTSPNRLFLAIDRDRDQSTGAALTTGVSFWSTATVGVLLAGTGAISWHQRCPSTGGVGNATIHNLPCIFPRISGTWGRGGNVGAGAIIPWDGGMYPQTIACHAVSSTDFVASDTAVSITVYGTAHNYRVTSVSTGSQNTGTRAVIPWE